MYERHTVRNTNQTYTTNASVDLNSQEQLLETVAFGVGGIPTFLLQWGFCSKPVQSAVNATKTSKTDAAVSHEAGKTRSGPQALFNNN